MIMQGSGSVKECGTKTIDVSASRSVLIGTAGAQLALSGPNASRIPIGQHITESQGQGLAQDRKRQTPE